MLEPSGQNEEAVFVPLWVFFASGYKWLGGFAGGSSALFITEMITTDPIWISIVTSLSTFAGWSTGTFLDINTYINERLPK